MFMGIHKPSGKGRSPGGKPFGGPSWYMASRPPSRMAGPPPGAVFVRSTTCFAVAVDRGTFSRRAARFLRIIYLGFADQGATRTSAARPFVSTRLELRSWRAWAGTHIGLARDFRRFSVFVWCWGK